MTTVSLPPPPSATHAQALTPPACRPPINMPKCSLALKIKDMSCTKRGFAAFDRRRLNGANSVTPPVLAPAVSQAQTLVAAAWRRPEQSGRPLPGNEATALSDQRERPESGLEYPAPGLAGLSRWNEILG